ncbi:F0F1 ATP synthase subunit A [Nibricoccus sp. IMCC34717]|uniref:F0F1 ATP synthase subunit A n=1 Tax=Nibricoccus sp. IMCC34717 TaxID=3034021 RepID=UPI00384C930D
MSAFHRTFTTALFLALTGASAFGAEGGHEKAASLKGFLGVPVTNSILTSFLITAAIIILVRWAVGKPGIIPSRGQAVVESAVDALRGLYEPIVGKKAMPMAFPVLITLFVFIVMHNWSGLLPGVGTVGWGSEHNGSFHVDTPLIRPHTSELNGTIALALISFGAWIVIVMRYAGPGLLLKDLFGNKADKKELAPVMYWGLSLVFLVVGCIEVVSIFIRPVTLSMRLFGNVFGGENLLHAMHFLPPFYFLELLVGFVQGLVFTLLSAVYIGLICNHGDDHGDEHAEGHEAAHH